MRSTPLVFGFSQPLGVVAVAFSLVTGLSATAAAEPASAAAGAAAPTTHIRPHFDKPWRQRVAEAQAAYLATPPELRQRSATRSPPPQPTRSANERWEVDGLVLAWECSGSPSSPSDWDEMWLAMIDAAWDHADLYIYILGYYGGSDASDVARCKSMVSQQLGRDPEQAVWFNEEDDLVLDSIWIRDYGPFFVFDEEKAPGIVDGDYVRYNRYHDDAQPAHFAAELGLTNYTWDFATEGGNFLANGNGICLVSETIYGLNPGLSEATIRQNYHDYLGCTNLIILPAVEDVTGHVDMWMFWLDHKTLFVAEYTAQQNASARAQMEQAVAEQLTGLTDPVTGEAIEIVRIPMPDDDYGIWRTYTNGVWIDDTFLMPVYTGYEATEAIVTAAIEARGATVAPIDADQIISSAGAMHCITKTIPSPAGLPDGPGPGIDAGPNDPDAAPVHIDAGPNDPDANPADPDGGVSVDGGNGGDGDPSAGCGCRSTSTSGGSLWLFALVALLLCRRPRRRRH